MLSRERYEIPEWIKVIIAKGQRSVDEQEMLTDWLETCSGDQWALYLQLNAESETEGIELDYDTEEDERY